jgi:hypothetical protein
MKPAKYVGAERKSTDKKKYVSGHRISKFKRVGTQENIDEVGADGSFHEFYSK